MRTYQQIQDEIAKLEEEARQVFGAAREQAIADIKIKISEFGLTAKDLGFTAKPPSAQAVKERLPAKYFGPQGQGWSGRGRQPEWIKEALAAGKTLDDFLS